MGPGVSKKHRFLVTSPFPQGAVGSSQSCEFAPPAAGPAPQAAGEQSPGVPRLPRSLFPRREKKTHFSRAAEANPRSTHPLVYVYKANGIMLGTEEEEVMTLQLPRPRGRPSRGGGTERAPARCRHIRNELFSLR